MRCWARLCPAARLQGEQPQGHSLGFLMHTSTGCSARFLVASQMQQEPGTECTCLEDWLKGHQACHLRAVLARCGPSWALHT